MKEKEDDKKEVEETGDVTHIDPTRDPLPDQPQYPGIPPELVEELKEKYRIVFGTYFGEKPVLYRTFNVDDYLKYQDDYVKLSDRVQMENSNKPVEARMTDIQLRDYTAAKADSLLVETFVVHPENIMEKIMNDELPGGAVYTLAQSILVNNGFVDSEPLVLSEKEIESDPTLLKDLDDNILRDIGDLTASKVMDEMVKPYKEVVVLWFLNQLYIARGFTYSEYSEVKKMTDSMDPVHLSIELVKRFTLYPDNIDLDIVPAGVTVKGLADSILMISGFTSTTPDIVIME